MLGQSGAFRRNRSDVILQYNQALRAMKLAPFNKNDTLTSEPCEYFPHHNACPCTDLNVYTFTFCNMI